VERIEVLGTEEKRGQGGGRPIKANMKAVERNPAQKVEPRLLGQSCAVTLEGGKKD